MKSTIMIVIEHSGMSVVLEEITIIILMVVILNHMHLGNRISHILSGGSSLYRVWLKGPFNMKISLVPKVMGSAKMRLV